MITLQIQRSLKTAWMCSALCTIGMLTALAEDKEKAEPAPARPAEACSARLDPSRFKASRVDLTKINLESHSLEKAILADPKENILVSHPASLMSASQRI